MCFEFGVSLVIAKDLWRFFLFSNSFSINFDRFEKTMELIQTFKTETEQETVRVAAELAKIFSAGDVVLLEGDLGTGKTFLVKALCRIWETIDEAASPTFAIIHQYRGTKPVNHFDLYRIEDVNELDNLGWEEFLETVAVTFIEWPEILEPQLDRYYKIKIEIRGSQRIFELYKYS